MKTISFAVPCYNSSEYMEHCVDSLLPLGEDIEIILVNDGSTKDNTAEIADRLEAEHLVLYALFIKRIKVMVARSTQGWLMRKAFILR